MRPTDAGVALFGGEAYRSAPFHRGILDRITLGAVIENIVVRAGRLGDRAEVALADDASRRSLVAEIGLKRFEAVPAGLDEAIADRHTDRGLGLSGPPLPANDLAQFVRLVGDIGGASLASLDAAPQRSAQLGLVRRAETKRFAVPSLHEDLFDGVRFDVGRTASTVERLPPAALGVEPGVRWAFARLRDWPVMEALTFASMHHFLGFRAATLPCRLAPHCSVLTTTRAPEPGSLVVGRALERAWLDAARRSPASAPRPTRCTRRWLASMACRLSGATTVRARYAGECRPASWLLRVEGKHRVVLAMHASDVRRATLPFERPGLGVVPARTQAPRPGDSHSVIGLAQRRRASDRTLRALRRAGAVARIQVAGLLLRWGECRTGRAVSELFTWHPWLGR